MNSKKWTVVVIAIILVIATSLSSIGLQNQEETYSKVFNNLFEEAHEVILEEGSNQDRILVINVDGTIDSSERHDGYSQKTTLHAVESIKQDDSIKAVLLSLDTPGGRVYETREVYDLFKKIQEEVDIPVYASMGSMAASGGLYYAMLADEIYAGPETVTGSIGVIMSSVNVEGLYEKLGIDSVVYKSGEHKDMMSSTRSITKEEEDILNNFIDEKFNDFVQAVAEGRGMDEDSVRKIADGRIYTAQQALDLNLIDGIMYEEEVIEKIKEDIGVAQPQIFQFEATPSKLSSYFSFARTEFFDKIGQSELEKTMNEIESMSKMKIEYRWEGF